MENHHGRGERLDEFDRLSVVELIFLLRRHLWLFLLLPLAFATALVVGSLLSPRTYTATAAFTAHSRESRVAGAAGLARQLGLDLGADRTGHSPQFYADLVRGPAIMTEVVRTEYTTRLEGEAVTGPLVQILRVPPEDGRPADRVAAEQLAKNVVTSVNRETGVVQVRVSLSDPALAELVLSRVLELVNDFNLEARRSQAALEARFVEEILEQTQAELRIAEGNLRSFLERNRHFQNSAELVFEHDRLNRDVMLKHEVHTALARSYEQARIDVLRNTPVISVVESPLGSGRPDSRGTVVKGLIGLVAGFAIALVAALLADNLKRARNRGGENYAGFVATTENAGGLLRSPTAALKRDRHAARE